MQWDQLKDKLKTDMNTQSYKVKTTNDTRNRKA